MTFTAKTGRAETMQSFDYAHTEERVADFIFRQNTVFCTSVDRPRPFTGRAFFKKTATR